MTIKQQGGIFGRNPTFNDVDVEGTLTVNGEPISDFGTMAQQDADSVNIDGGSIDGTVIGANTKANVTGASAVFDDLNVDSINVNGNTISTSSGDLTLSPTNDATFTNGKLSVQKSGDAFTDIKGELFVSSNRYAGLATQAGARIILKSDNTTAWSGGREMVTLEYVGNGADHRTGSLSIKVKKGAGDADPTEMLLIDGYRNKTTIQSGNLAFPSGAGIDFSATAGTGTSELFSDYEEGTWTPAITFSGGDGTGSWSYTTQNGQYTKVGNTVRAAFQIRLSAFTKGTASGTPRISGLPFNFAVELCVGNIGLFDASFSSQPIIVGVTGAAQMDMLRIQDNNAWAALNDPDADAQYFGVIVYQAS